METFSPAVQEKKQEVHYCYGNRGYHYHGIAIVVVSV